MLRGTLENRKQKHLALVKNLFFLSVWYLHLPSNSHDCIPIDVISVMSS